MNRTRNHRTNRGMSHEAYAGFLKLWLTPANRIPSPTPEIDAYLRYASNREPLSVTSRRALSQPEHRAA